MKPEYISKPDWEILIHKYPDHKWLEQKLQSGYPPQYLIGNVEFLNTKILVDERVLIPRFETETLVDNTIKYAHTIFSKSLNILDLGTGSGCIAISLKKNLDATVTAIDISCEALEVAKKNAQINNVNIKFINQNMTDSLINYYDIIISNPPYIPKDGFVEQKVKDYEPNLALFAEDDGLYFYKTIITKHWSHLNKPGLMAFEIGEHQKEKLEKMLQLQKLHYVFQNDLQGLPRYLFIFNE